jgi:predicted PurR-regulated permease PerM
MLGARQVARAILVAVTVLFALYVVYRLRLVVGLLAASIFLAVALAPAVDLVQRRRVPRAAAILVVYVTILGGLFGLVLVLAPPIVDGVDRFIRKAPQYVRDIRDSSTLRRYDRRYHLVSKLEAQANRLPSTVKDAVGELESVTVGVFKRLLELITVLTLAFFFLLDGPRMADFLFRQLDPAREARARAVATGAVRAVGGYAIGALAIAALAGLVSFAFMEVFGIGHSVPLAVQMAFFALIPLVGSAIGAIPIAVAAGLHGFPTELIVWVAFFLVYQQVESRVLGPFVYRRTVALHPVLAIVSVIAGASLLGILGALIAIPVAAIVQIVVKDWWRFRSLPAAPPAGEAAPAG